MGQKSTCFNLIWEVNGHKLSNLVTSYPIWSPMIKIMPRKFSNPSGIVVSTMFCKEKSAKKFIFFARQF